MSAEPEALLIRDCSTCGMLCNVILEDGETCTDWSPEPICFEIDDEIIELEGE